MSNKLTSGTARVDARLLLVALVHINNGSATIQSIQLVTGLSKASAERLLANARKQYGVSILWRSKIGYIIADWGVFDAVKVGEFITNGNN